MISSDQFLSEGLLGVLFQTFCKSCSETDLDTQRDLFCTIVEPIRDAYFRPLLEAQERVRALEPELQRAQSGIFQMLQTMTENSRRESEIREAANVRENELRNENRTQAETIVGMNEIIARVKEDSWAENEKHSNIVTQLKEASWAENKKFAETIAGLKEDFCGAAELRRGEAALNEARISGEAQRWYNEYRNLLEAGSQPIGREIKGSESRARVWQGILDDPDNLVDQILPVNQMGSYDDDAINDLLNTHHDQEPQIYAQFTALMAGILDSPMNASSPGVRVIDTSKRYYLKGMAPDLTISVGGVLDADAASVYMVIEVKLNENALTSRGNLGQLVDYMVEIKAAQPSRRFFAGMLTNLHKTVVLLLESVDGEKDFMSHHIAVDLQTALSYIEETVLAHPGHRPPARGFSEDLKIMLRRLGKPTNSIVGEFHIPEKYGGRKTGGATMAVKRSHADPPSFQWSEVKVLEMILEQAPSRIAVILPTLVFSSPDGREFGITPVGMPLIADQLPRASEVRGILNDILEALIWLHELPVPLIHRDVRSQNIIVRRDQGRARGVLIDFDNVAIAGCDTSYRGGYLCCPRELIGKVGTFTRYSPQPRHDYEAFVLMANMLAFPGRGTRAVHWQQVKKEGSAASRLRDFWSDIECSPVWGKYLKAAELEQPTELREISNMFVFL